jgi:hypothetical protein
MWLRLSDLYQLDGWARKRKILFGVCFVTVKFHHLFVPALLIKQLYINVSTKSQVYNQYEINSYQGPVLDVQA